ncbi:hypothetical protein [Cellulosimicrobium cellulans]|uniref:P22 coat protein-protein 5 domain protein n=1 Tax=Cellulosimicrobium cellulans TaxID=1710 RepID=A0A4Y4DZD4_CELCE|nr:hypothetical protein [Cellulosimicrobium cellulans]GED09164.1 hypothetical protein CCE02nite_11630 [Cellulosimicrobium cellulans]
MPNTFTPTLVAQVAVKYAVKGFVLSGEVYRDVESEYRPGSGHVAKVRVPGGAKTTLRDANDLSTIPASNLDEKTIDVTLREAHSRAVLGTAERDLGITDFTRQVIAPLVTSVADTCEAQVAGLVNAVTLNDTVTYADGGNLAKAITAARSILRGNGVQTADEIVAFLGVDAYAAALDSGLLENGDSIRRVRIIETDRMTNPADVVVAAPKRAFTLAVRAPEVPDGVASGASVKDEDAGFGLRYVETFDGSIAASTALVSAYVGAKALPLPVLDPETGTVNLVEGGAAVRFTAA